jgi:hypothetical protein
MASDKRHFRRAGVSIPITFRPADLRHWLPGSLIDLSAGGLRFATPEVFQPDQELEFELTLPIRQQPFQMAGRVMWERTIPGGMEYGVAFSNVSIDQQAQMDQLVMFFSESPPR